MKKTLLIAAATLAAGIISVQAQVYSQNIVGYANVATPVGGTFYQITVPFNVGISNGINEVFGNTLPAGSSILQWNSGIQDYVTTVYDNSDPAGLGTNVVWYQSDDFTPVSKFPTLPVGSGFFLNPNGPITNVFTGTIAVSVGTSNTMTLPSSGTFYLVSSVVPYAGALTNGNNSTGGPNLNNLPSGTSVLVWSPSIQDYITYVYDTSDPAGLGTNVVWYQSDDFTPTNAPQISVGQSFFINPNAPYNWTTGL